MGKPKTPDYKKWIVVNLMPFWIYVRIKRPYKEMAKDVLFSLFPFIFTNRIEYIHWKAARIFVGPDYTPFRWSFWKKIWTNSTDLPLPAETTKPETGQVRLAVVIHAFYPEILTEILGQIREENDMEIKLFVSCTEMSKAEVNDILIQQPLPYLLEIYENRGRDVLPFLQILPKIKEEGFELLLKLHTKKSSHLINNTFWKEDILDKLIGKDRMAICAKLLQSNCGIGMIGPEGHLLPMAMYYSNNAEKVKWLCEKMNLAGGNYHHLYFVAGTMFYARMNALLPLLDLGLSTSDFEEEDGQVDGTMAHAIERALSASCLINNYYIIDASSREGNLHSKAVLHYSFSI